MMMHARTFTIESLTPNPQAPTVHWEEDSKAQIHTRLPERVSRAEF